MGQVGQYHVYFGICNMCIYENRTFQNRTFVKDSTSKNMFFPFWPILSEHHNNFYGAKNKLRTLLSSKIQKIVMVFTQNWPKREKHVFGGSILNKCSILKCSILVYTHVTYSEVHMVLPHLPH